MTTIAQTIAQRLLVRFGGPWFALVDHIDKGLNDAALRSCGHSEEDEL